MKDNVFLFSGDSPYLLWQELRKWKNSFAAKYGEQYIFSFSSDNFDIPTIIDTIFSGGLFVTKKLWVCSSGKIWDMHQQYYYKDDTQDRLYLFIQRYNARL